MRREEQPAAACCSPLRPGCAAAPSFTAESEREKREWMEALQEAIAEMLYDYEVAEKIWSNKANKFCADCWAQSPDWASINLCVVICKQCAGGRTPGGARGYPGLRWAGVGPAGCGHNLVPQELGGADSPAPCRAAP